jgi:sugar/nucleoside kinase (ribokinase family)
VAVTLGADGALWCAGGTVVHRPAVPVVVVDTTGAGDAFTAGALSVWVERPGDAAGCLAAGLGLAAEVVGRPGAR